jgi:hypothetical protein
MVKGAIDRVLEMCVGYLSRGVDHVVFTSQLKERILQQARGMGNSGLRGIFYRDAKNILFKIRKSDFKNQILGAKYC